MSFLVDCLEDIDEFKDLIGSDFDFNLDNVSIMSSVDKPLVD
jgi:hypothetical protein